MPRPFTRDQALQNARFLAALRRTGNAREAARALGVHRSTMLKRRAKDAAFAAEWDAALALAHACLQNPPRDGEGDHAKHGGGGPAKRAVQSGSPRGTTSRGVDEPHIIRTASGRLQLRRPTVRRLTRAAEQAFLAALSATANVRLSAAAAGFSHSAFYERRKASPAFAREMRLALQMGYERIELALLESFAPDSYADDAWRHNDPPAIPPMSANQALQLLHLHQKEARLLAEPNHVKRRRGESAEAHSVRMEAMGRGWLRRREEEFYIAEAARRERGIPRLTGPIDLPDLSHIGGWTRADPTTPPHHEGVALFGGWRLKDWEEREAGDKKKR